MSEWRVRAFFGTAGIANLLVGTALLPYAVDESWFTWTPPGSSTPLTAFRPHVTFYASVAILVFGAIALLILLKIWRNGITQPARAVLFVSTGHLFLAAGLLLVALFNYSFLFQCADPGGCSEAFVPYWPLIAPGAIVLGVGTLGLIARLTIRPPTSSPT